MARKTAEYLPAVEDDVVDVFEINAQPGEEIPKTEQQRKLEDIISDLNDSSEGDAEIRVYRQSRLGGKSAMTMLEVFPADKYNSTELWQFLRDKYGAGDYRIHVRADGHLKANKLMTIETPVEAAPTEVGVGGEVATALNAVLSTIQEQNRNMMEFIQGQQNNTSEDDILRKMVVYKELFSNGSSGNGLSQINETLTVLQGLGIEIGPNNKEEDGFGSAIEKLAPLATALVQNPQAQQTPPPQPNPKQREDAMLKNLMLKAGLNSLLKAAAKNADAGFYADWVLDQLDPKTVAEFITSPDAMEKMSKLAPMVAQYGPWFEELSEHIKGQLGMESKYAADYAHLNDDENSVITPESTSVDSDTLDSDSTDIPAS